MPGRMAPADRDDEGARPMTCATDRCYLSRGTIQRASTVVNSEQGYELDTLAEGPDSLFPR